jgi:hypothetical protein
MPWFGHHVRKDTKGACAMTATTDTAIVIRRANDDDALALRRLAQLDGTRLPEGDMLVAEAGGEIRAALRIADSAYVADPFFPSRPLVGMLDTRAKAIRRTTTSRLDRVRTRVSLWSALRQRASETSLML